MAAGLFVVEALLLVAAVLVSEVLLLAAAVLVVAVLLLRRCLVWKLAASARCHNFAMSSYSRVVGFFVRREASLDLGRMPAAAEIATDNTSK